MGRKKGFCQSCETKEKISVSHQGQKHFYFGKHLSDEHKAKIKATKKMENHKPAHHSQATREKMCKNHGHFQKLQPNKEESQLLGLLDTQFPGEWKYVGNGALIIEGLCPDFVNINGKKQVIELFGDYWHSEKKLKRFRVKMSSRRLPWRSTELGRIMAFNAYGFKCLVIWGNELKDEASLIGKLKHFTKS